MREDAGHVDPLGLYDLERQIWPVGEAYRQLGRQWRSILRAESLILDPHPSRPGTTS